ncbi:MAG: hypothetical protein LBW77_07665 [Verrucomicrobiota bacterium]|jgi:hypothetical protein|nr:hypothetical protein [Verrucomicrobiota bacterium]
MDYLLYAFHIALLLFWTRLWSVPSKEFYFNPFLSGTARLTDSVLVFLRPVLALPEQAAACAVLLFILFFKTVVLWRLGGDWLIQLGMSFEFAPRAADGQFAPVLLFSALQAALFLVRLWTVYLLVRLITPAARTTRAGEALAFFARPFSDIPLFIQPVVLFALHALLALCVTRLEAFHAFADFGQAIQPMSDQAAAPSPFLSGPLYAQLLKTGWLAALSFADGLMLLTRGLVILIVGNFVSAMFQSRGVAIICSEGVELLMGRFARRVGAGTGFDFTPLIFFFVINLLYTSICQGLSNLIRSPYLN